MADKDITPSPINTMLYFLFLTLFYGIISVYNISNSVGMSDTEKNSKNIIINLIYSLLLLSGLFFLNLKSSKQICPGSETFQYYNVFIYTIIPWLLIYGILYFLLDIFDGWVKPFSNTIGYMVVNILGAETQLDSFLNQNTTNTIDNNDLVIAIKKIGSNRTMFVNQFSHDLNDFNKFFEELKHSKIFKEKIDEDEKTEFFKLITIKHIIGKLIWYILAGTLIASISFNYLIQMKCDSDIDKVSQKIKDFYDQNKTKPDGSYWLVSKSMPSNPGVCLYGLNNNGDYEGQQVFKENVGKYNGLITYLIDEININYNNLINNENIQLSNSTLRRTKILQNDNINLNDYIKLTVNDVTIDYESNGDPISNTVTLYFIAAPNPDDS